MHYNLKNLVSKGVYKVYLRDILIGNISMTRDLYSLVIFETEDDYELVRQYVPWQNDEDERNEFIISSLIEVSKIRYGYEDTDIEYSILNQV